MTIRRTKFAGPLLVFALLLVPKLARATYSVVAVDLTTKQTGGAGTSCVGPLKISAIYGAVPGVGALLAQARMNTAGRDEGVKLLAAGKTPAQVIVALTAASFDPNAASRQFGVVDLKGASAGFTGSTTMAWAGDHQGTAGSFVYSAQGNILSGRTVLTQTETAFISGGGCDMAARLMLALEAGAKGAHGDRRCTKSAGIPSDAAFLRVDDVSGKKLIHIEVTNTKPQSPLPLLRKQFDAWRQKNPCAKVDAKKPADRAVPDVPNASAVESNNRACVCRLADKPNSHVSTPALFCLLALLVGARRRRGLGGTGR